MTILNHLSFFPGKATPTGVAFSIVTDFQLRLQQQRPAERTGFRRKSVASKHINVFRQYRPPISAAPEWFLRAIVGAGPCPARQHRPAKRTGFRRKGAGFGTHQCVPYTACTPVGVSPELPVQHGPGMATAPTRCSASVGAHPDLRMRYGAGLSDAPRRRQKPCREHIYMFRQHRPAHIAAPEWFGRAIVGAGPCPARQNRPAKRTDFRRKGAGCGTHKCVPYTACSSVGASPELRMQHGPGMAAAPTRCSASVGTLPDFRGLFFPTPAFSKMPRAYPCPAPAGTDCSSRTGGCGLLCRSRRRGRRRACPAGSCGCRIPRS